MNEFLKKRSEERRQEFDSHISDEIRTLIQRGNVTLAELSELRLNSWEWQALVPAMTDEAFVNRMRHALDNCHTTGERPFSTYNQAVEGLWAPELLKRFGATKCVHWCECGQPWLPAGGLYGTTEEMRCHGCALREMLTRERSELTAAKRTADDFAETLDGVREALGQKETHYLCIPDDVRIAIRALEWYAAQAFQFSVRAQVTLGTIRNQAMHTRCEVCSKKLIVMSSDDPSILCSECGGSGVALPAKEVIGE